MSKGISGARSVCIHATRQRVFTSSSSFVFTPKWCTKSGTCTGEWRTVPTYMTKCHHESSTLSILSYPSWLRHVLACKKQPPYDVIHRTRRHVRSVDMWCHRFAAHPSFRRIPLQTITRAMGNFPPIWGKSKSLPGHRPAPSYAILFVALRAPVVSLVPS